MKRQWIKHRQFNPHQDGERRWDRAYQSLLLWAMESEPIPLMSSEDNSGAVQEVDHADSSLRAGLDQKSG